MVKFFRMSDKGTIKRPTLIAVMVIVTFWVITMFILNNHPFICVGICWPLEYIIIAAVLTSPFRITLGRLMHWSRYHTIMSVPTPTDKIWLEANKPVFEKTGLKLYTGESMNKIEKKIDDSKIIQNKMKASKKTIKVLYDEHRKEF